MNERKPKKRKVPDRDAYRRACVVQAWLERDPIPARRRALVPLTGEEFRRTLAWEFEPTGAGDRDILQQELLIAILASVSLRADTLPATLVTAARKAVQNAGQDYRRGLDNERNIRTTSKSVGERRPDGTRARERTPKARGIIELDKCRAPQGADHQDIDDGDDGGRFPLTYGMGGAVAGVGYVDAPEGFRDPAREYEITSLKAGIDKLMEDRPNKEKEAMDALLDGSSDRAVMALTGLTHRGLASMRRMVADYLGIVHPDSERQGNAATAPAGDSDDRDYGVKAAPASDSGDGEHWDKAA